jgi:serine/threonine protein kinase
VPSLAPKLDDETRNLPVLEPEADPRSSSVQCTEVSHYFPGALVDGKYELVRLLGEGGMGAVWVVRHRALGQHLALKLVRHDRGGAMAGAAERMLQEARAATSLAHPGIVQVFDFGYTRQGHPYITMELLHGESLGKVLDERGRIAPTRAVQLLLPIADALAAAHDRGVVHRDVKPDNVFLTHLADGRLQPKVLDFGIAKLGPELGPKLTVEGTVLGSPAYMSPEQARGEQDIDRRTDVWALSVVLYELVTGELPFQGESYNARLWAILGETPRSLLEHDVDEPELWAVLQCGLAKNRNERFADMREFGRTLAAWLLARNVKSDITKAPLEPWLAHSRPTGPSLFPSLSPSIAPSEPSAAPEPPARAAPPVRIVPADDPRHEPSAQVPPAVVPVTVDPVVLAAVRARVKKERARTTAPRSVRELPRKPWVGWFAAAAGASFVVAAIASAVGGREVAEARSRATAPVIVAVPVVAAPPAPPSAVSPRKPAVGAESSAESAPVRKSRPSARPSRPRPAPRPPRVDELKNPFR